MHPFRPGSQLVDTPACVLLCPHTLAASVLNESPLHTSHENTFASDMSCTYSRLALHKVFAAQRSAQAREL